jgi:hypothetical protein
VIVKCRANLFLRYKILLPLPYNSMAMAAQLKKGSLYFSGVVAHGQIGPISDAGSVPANPPLIVLYGGCFK